MPTIFLCCMMKLLTAAHFLRSGNLPMVALALMTLGLLWLKKRTWLRIFQITLVIDAAVWIVTLINVIHERAIQSAPYLRASMILGGVVLLVLWAIYLSNRPRFLARYPVNAHTLATLWSFMVILIGLHFFMTKLPIQLILLERFFPGFGVIEIALLALYGAAMTEFMLRDGSRIWRRLMWSLFSVVFFVQFGLGLSLDARFLQTGAVHIPFPALIIGGPLYRGGGIFMLALFLSTVILVGPAWCSYLCYIGSLDLNLARSRKSPRAAIPSPWFRVVTLLMTVITALALRFSLASQEVVWGTLLVFILLSLAAMLLSIKKGRMVHCSSFCPIGLLSNITGKLNPMRLIINNNCTHCGACSKACPHGALARQHIEQRSPGMTCTLCGDCLSACSHNALAYRFPYLSPTQAKTLFVTIVVVLHTIFLAVARI